MKPITRHEVRDSSTGALVAVLDLIEPDAGHSTMSHGTMSHGMVELAADIAGRSIRLRLYPPAQAEARRAA